MAVTEHCPGLKGSPTFVYFQTLRVLPRYMSGVMILRGAELNIMDFNGTVDLEERLLERLEWVIASFHLPAIDPGTVKEHTNSWMQIANNPHVDVIGHCGSPRYAFEHKPVIREFSKNGKIVEINANSPKERPGSYDICKEIAILCAEYSVPVVVNSDAHYCGDVGKFDDALAIPEEISFPEELVLNADYDRFIKAVNNINGELA